MSETVQTVVRTVDKIKRFHEVRDLLQQEPLATNQEEARAALARRRELAQTIPRIDNNELYAGSSMYFYCSRCGVPNQLLGECYHTSDRRPNCQPCIHEISHGFIPDSA
jgi:hypothetical protein